MEDRWKYPFYVIAILLLVLWLFGCDDQEASRPAVGPTHPTQVATVIIAAEGAPSCDDIKGPINVDPD